MAGLDGRSGVYRVDRHRRAPFTPGHPIVRRRKHGRRQRDSRDAGRETGSADPRYIEAITTNPGLETIVRSGVSLTLKKR